MYRYTHAVLYVLGGLICNLNIAIAVVVDVQNVYVCVWLAIYHAPIVAVIYAI